MVANVLHLKGLIIVGNTHQLMRDLASLHEQDGGCCPDSVVITRIKLLTKEMPSRFNKCNWTASYTRDI